MSSVLDNLIDEIEELSKNSDLPEKVDIKFWEQFIIKIINLGF